MSGPWGFITCVGGMSAITGLVLVWIDARRNR